MVRFALRLVASLAMSATAYAAQSGSGLQSNSSAAAPPSKDPFYAVPDGVEKFDPGAILKHRTQPSPIAASGWRPDNLQDTHQILYRTADNLGNATATVLTVMVPNNADYGKVLSFQVAEDAATVDCAPSYGFQLQTQSDPLLSSNITQVQLLLIEGALARGWVVITADSGGPEGAWGASKLAGYAILDGIRAAVNSGRFTGIKKKPKIAMWGYSGGSGITQTAAELQPLYAPELEIAGAAIGGTGTKDPTKMLTINKGPAAGLLPTALLGMANQYPKYRELIDRHLKPQYRQVFYRPLNQCLEANIATFRNSDILGMFEDWTLLFNKLITVKIFNDNQGNSIPKIPFFWYQCVRDELAPIRDIDAQVDKYCAEGVSVQYERNNAPGLNHTNYGLVGASGAVSWLGEVLDGKIPGLGCSRKTVHKSQLDPAFLHLFPKALRVALLQFWRGNSGAVQPN